MQKRRAKIADIYLLNKKCPDNTLVPCPYCSTFHTVHEYFGNEMQWRGEVIEAYMNLCSEKYYTACPTCNAKFFLCANEKEVGGSPSRLVYFSIPRKLKKYNENA